MSFLSRFLSYKKICIQCHNNPDADSLASAFGLYRFFCSKGVDSEIVFGGEQVLKKSNTKMLIRECGIPISHNCSPEGYDLLFMVDCQYGQGNENENFLIKSEYQSCATIIYELLLEENYPVKEDEALAVAFLYGLYTDTSSFADLFYSADIAMRGDLFENQSLFEQLTKSNMSLAELLVASDAMYNHYFDSERRFSIVEALKCDQTVLGMIGDFMIQVDSICLSFV
ncbi:MAG: DHH family phosphoesterase, partial [Bacillota bacterium]|nr:DHH family phosphoesterase [Bacillota bacterium]